MTVEGSRRYRARHPDRIKEDLSRRYSSEQYRKWNRERMKRRRSEPRLRVREDSRRLRRERLADIKRMREELSAA